MFDILRLLIQFVFRVTFGLALAMGLTPPRLVTSGYYQKHLWVLMGMNTLASLAVYSQRAKLSGTLVGAGGLLAVAIGLAIGAYVGSVCWLAERPWGGRLALFLVAAGGLAAAILATPGNDWASGSLAVLTILDLASGGLLLGTILAAMFLGHWYLNTPTMELAPLRRLVVLLACAVAARAVVGLVGVWLRAQGAEALPTEFWIFLSLRWLAGLAGTLAIAWLTWETLKVPNTQSATGLLYAGVVLAFIGELTSQLMSAGEVYPV